MSQKVTRFEVIDDTGRAYVREGVSVLVAYQDDGKTLKVFVGKAAQRRSPVKNPLAGTWSKREDKEGRFMDVLPKARPFLGKRKRTALVVK